MVAGWKNAALGRYAYLSQDQWARKIKVFYQLVSPGDDAANCDLRIARGEQSREEALLLVVRDRNVLVVTEGG